MSASTPVLLKYYGAKNLIARRIISLMRPHRTYVEPFFGSGAVLFMKKKSQVEIANDIDGEVVNFFRVVRDQPDRLIEALDFTPYARDEFEGLPDLPPTDDPVERARRFFVRLNAAFSGGTTGGFSVSGGGKINQAELFRSRVSQIRPYAWRLRTVEFENTDALEVIDRHDRPDTLFYLDPPYLAETRDSENGYSHESKDQRFHTALLKRLGDVQGQVVLSGYAHPLYEEMLSGWTRHEVYSRVVAKETRSRRTEVLWVNRQGG